MITKEEQALQDALINTYTYNLQFLSEYDKALYERVSVLSDVINKNQYAERYFLEFIKENNEFDIYDSHTEKYLYDRKPKQWNNTAILKSNFDVNNTINLLKIQFYERSIVDLSEENQNMMSINALQLKSDIQNYQDIKHEDLRNKKKKIKLCNKFIFVGTLLGRHIPKIVKKLSTVNHFVCESNLEIFRLSLFVCDYSLLARDGKSVVFSIMEEEQQFFQKFQRFFDNQFTENTVFKYFSSNYNIENYFDRIMNIVLERDPLIFDYGLMLNNIVNLATQNFNKYKTLNFSKVNLGANILTDNKILFVGAGPSLGENIEWLKEHQNKFVIVCMGAALKKLTQHDIKPDIVTTLDPQEKVILNHFNTVAAETLEQIVKIVSINTSKKVFDLLDSDSEAIFTFELSKSLQKGNMSVDGISVGEVTFKLLMLLQAKEIYLLGLDLALNQKTGHTHIDTHSGHGSNQFEIDTNKQDNESMLKQSFSLREDTILTKGNFGGKVTTTRLFYVSLMEYNRSIQYFKQENQNIYNLSENGAFIENTFPTKIEAVHFDTQDINKNELHKILIKNLNQVSVKELEKSDQDNIQSEINQLENILITINNFKGLKIKSYYEFKKEVELIINEILRIQSYSTFLPEIFLNFYAIINRYIDFTFNDREIKNDKKYIKEIQYIWCEHLSQIIKTYRGYLERLI